MTTKFGTKISDAQFKFARRFETAGLTSISQAVKAFERRNDEQIEAWKKQLAEIDAKNGRSWNETK